MQTSWKLEPLVEFELTTTDSIPPQHLQPQNKVCLDKGAQQSSVNRWLQSNKQACIVPVNDAADNATLINIPHTQLKSHSEHSPVYTTPPQVS